MTNLSKISAISAIALTLIACASPQTRTPVVTSESTKAETKKQQELVVEDYMSNYKKLQKVASKITNDGVALCGDKIGSYYGFNYWNQDSFSPSLKEAAKK